MFHAREDTRCIIQEPNPAIHINKRIAYDGITVCQAVADSSSVKLSAAADRANRRRHYGEGEGGWPDATLPHGVEETERLIRKRAGDVAGEHGVVGDRVPVRHPVEQPARVLQEAGAEERRQEDVVREHVRLGGGSAQDCDGGRCGAEAGVCGAEAVGEVRGAEEGAGAAEEAGVQRRRSDAGSAAGEERGGDARSEERSVGRGRRG